ncbi:MAG TPA: preprotein translocase subunit SecA [Patescibacteria group bacterium]|nr:preprotein translocase subunit SecA [Patescibacteria group bacterium]
MIKFFKKLLGSDIDPYSVYGKELGQINKLQDEVSGLSHEQIKAEIVNFKTELTGIKDLKEVFKILEEIRPRVYALTREAAKRSIGQFHYDVQILGGIALSKGNIAEMRTGEGKTLTGTLPLVLHALTGRGAHLVTVNDYLARWQASLMGPIFHYLGLSIASIQHEKSFLFDPAYEPDEEEVKNLEAQTVGFVMDVKNMRVIRRQEAYAADITFGTNNEFGFDYLRDNMVQSRQQRVQRELFFAIVDEVDSILIDEARTPLIISQPDIESSSKYLEFAKIVSRLEEGVDYEVDEKRKAAPLTDDGITKIEKILGVQNIYDTSKGVTTLHHIEQAVKALALFKRDRDYVVRDGEVVIVDEFTGRLMFGRRYSDGLHQAIEAKEGAKIQQESKTLATITFQNLFRLYDRLAGMTGTAKTEEEEFFKIYRLQVITIPTNKPNIRIDSPDTVYKTQDAKFAAIAADVKARFEKGQPVLIGTVSIAKNELLAEHLQKAGVPFEILNAKNHEREAQIIAQAGRYGAVTLATNIAGRGVDILLGGNPVDQEDAAAVRKAGGLHVVGTERHESRRIDNQLRGRSGRQGDPGSSQFFVSLEDDLMRLFGGERLKGLMDTLGLEDTQPIDSKLVSRSIEQAQKKIEGLNFDTRKHVLEFDDVLNHQREIIYKRRRKYLGLDSEEFSITAEVVEMIKQELADIVRFTFETNENHDEALANIYEQVQTIFPVSEELKGRIAEAKKNAADREFVVLDELSKEAEELLEKKKLEVGSEIFEGVLKFVVLQSVDMLWMEHLDTMDHLRDSVRLRGYGQRDPLVEYKKEGFGMFKRLVAGINKQVVYTVYKLNIQPTPASMVTPEQNIPQSTNATTQYDLPPDLELSKVGRNDPCPCGSGKKFKKCHGTSL